MALQAGSLNRLITLQTVAVAADSGGGSVETWANTATVWARVEALTGDEGFQAMQVAASVSHRVTIRKRTVTPQQRVKYGAKIFKIRAVRPDERDELIELLCDEEHIA